VKPAPYGATQYIVTIPNIVTASMAAIPSLGDTSPRERVDLSLLSICWERGSPEPLRGWDKSKEERLWRAALPANECFSKPFDQKHSQTLRSAAKRLEGWQPAPCLLPSFETLDEVSLIERR